MRTRFIRCRASASACPHDRPRCRTRASAIWLPMVKTGLSEVIGSWKIMPMEPPRTERICLSLIFRTSVPSSRIRPSIRDRPAGRSRMVDSAVTLLPEPDSPTMATVSPASTCRLISRMTGIQPSDVLNEVVRFSTASTGGVVVMAVVMISFLWPVVDQRSRAGRLRATAAREPRTR
jgi:hypothetical protein